jgi:hypothetical protein
MAIGKPVHGAVDPAKQSMVAHTYQRTINHMAKSADTDSGWVEREKALLRIVGARLTSVQFVLNYLILGFDEKGALTTLVWPEVLKKDERTTFGMAEYRNKLCSAIERIVKSATIEHDETISIHYDDGTEMRIPLQSYQLSGERAIMTGPKHYLFVF